MSSEIPPVPTTWPDLLARRAASPGADRRGFDYFHAELVGKPADGLLFATPFQSCAEAIAATLLLGDATVAAGQVAALAPWVGQIAQDGAAVLPRARLTALGLIAMAEMTRTPLPADVGAAPGLLPALRGFEAGADIRAAIWAYLGFGVVAGLDVLLPGDLKAPPEAGAAFGANVQGAQVQIARAIALRAPLAEVAAAWDGYLHHVPRLIAAGQGSMLELILAARACLGVLGGQGGPQVLDSLRAAIR